MREGGSRRLKSPRDSNARLPPPQVYDSAERDRDNDDSAPNYWYKNSSGRQFI